MRKALHVVALAIALVPGSLVALHASVAEAAPAAPAAAVKDPAAVCASLKTDARVDADVRAVEKGIAILLKCKDVTRDPALAYWTDRPQLGQLARLAVVSDCLGTDFDRPSDLLEALRCYPDLQLLDRTKLDAELDADARFDNAAKATLRQAMDDVRGRADSWKRQATALVAKSPEARAVLFDEPAKALAEWQAAYVTSKDGVDAALSYSAKVGNESARGCSFPMRRHLAEYLAKKNERSVASTSAALAEPIGFPIVEALARCEQLDGEPLAAQALNDAFLAKTTKWHRGPRVAAYWAGVDAIDASDSAQRLFGASFRVYRKFPRDRVQVVATTAQEHEQVIASVKAVKGGTRLMLTEGAPLFVSTAHASGLAAGEKVVYLQDGRGGAHVFPLSVYADKAKKNPVAYMGTSLVGVAAH